MRDEVGCCQRASWPAPPALGPSRTTPHGRGQWQALPRRGRRPEAQIRPTRAPPHGHHQAPFRRSPAAVRDAAPRAADANHRRNTAARHRPPRDLRENNEDTPPPPSLGTTRASPVSPPAAAKRGRSWEGRLAARLLYNRNEETSAFIKAGGQPVAADSASSRRNRRRQKKSSNANAAAAAAPVVAVPAPVPPTPMQRLFDTSHEVFAGSATGFVPPPDAVARLAAILSEHPLQRRRATWGSPVLLRWSCNATPVAELQRCVHGPQVIGGAAELRCSASSPPLSRRALSLSHARSSTRSFLILSSIAHGDADHQPPAAEDLPPGDDHALALAAPPRVTLLTVPLRVSPGKDEYPMVLAVDPSGLLLLSTPPAPSPPPSPPSSPDADGFVTLNITDRTPPGYYVCDASSSAAARLPGNGRSFLDDRSVGLLASPAGGGHYMVVELQPLIGSDEATLLCFSSVTGRWK
nr:putative uncharacterized protein ENSP00000383309 [Aegilops tauschii subsp. strangulata]